MQNQINTIYAAVKLFPGITELQVARLCTSSRVLPARQTLRYLQAQGAIRSLSGGWAVVPPILPISNNFYTDYANF